MISASAVAVLAAAGVLIGLLVSVESAPVLIFSVSSGWWYPQDAKHQVDASADLVQQTTVPVRWHQQQGFYVQLWNLSGYTQTVVGLAPRQAALDAVQWQAGMSTANYGSGWPGLARSQHYTLPVSIPPGQSRYLRLMWTSDLCAEAGGTASTDQVKLLVRVGWITRTEDVGLGQAWAVTGTKQSTC